MQPYNTSSISYIVNLSANIRPIKEPIEHPAICFILLCILFKYKYLSAPINITPRIPPPDKTKCVIFIFFIFDVFVLSGLIFNYIYYIQILRSS